MDADGYPTEEELEVIAKWQSKRYDFTDLLGYVKDRWRYADCGYFTQDGNYYKISTGGWSGNEDIIGALQQNLMFWGLCWLSSRRGGHYEFDVRKPKDDKSCS